MTQILDPELFLPEPEPAVVKYTVISVDDHLVEPRDMFEGRLPAKLQERAPKVVTNDAGHEVWEFEGNSHYQSGMNAVAGRRPSSHGMEPFRFSEMRPSCYDPHARVHDMDLGGIWAAVNFPSMITGFCGRVYSSAQDPELGLATTRAYNDWMVEEWWQQHPDRFIPLGITFLADPDKAAAEIRRNAARGVVAVSLPERPHKIGLPSIFDESWDPVMRACADTDTVICQHVGSSGLADVAPGAPSGTTATLFGQLALDVVRGVGVVRLAAAISRPEDRDVRGRARLGRDAARSSRLHGRSWRVPVERIRPRRATGRRRPAQLLVLHHRRPLDDRHPPSHRRRERDARGRLSRTATPRGPTRNASSRITGVTFRTTSSGS